MGKSLTVNGWIYELTDGMLRDLDFCVGSIEEAAKAIPPRTAANPV